MDIANLGKLTILLRGCKVSKCYKIKSRQKKSPRSWEVWSDSEDLCLIEFFEKGYCAEVISKLHERTKSGIAARLVKLSLIEKRSDFYDRRGDNQRKNVKLHKKKEGWRNASTSFIP